MNFEEFQTRDYDAIYQEDLDVFAELGLQPELKKYYELGIIYTKLLKALE